MKVPRDQQAMYRSLYFLSECDKCIKSFTVHAVHAGNICDSNNYQASNDVHVMARLTLSHIASSCHISAVN